MRIADMDWRMVEDWVRHDDRAILPLGSTEQHAGLSLATDAILSTGKPFSARRVRARM